MTDSGGLQQSLVAVGFLQLALAFGALGCYALILNGSLGTKARTTAAGCAAVTAGALAALTDPWMNGVILIALGIAGIGVFVLAAWGISALCGLAGRRIRGPATTPAGRPLPQPASTSALAQAVLALRRLPKIVWP